MFSEVYCNRIIVMDSMLQKSGIRYTSRIPSSSYYAHVEMGLQAYRTSHVKNIYILARTEPREAWEKKAMFEIYAKAMKPIGKKVFK